MNFIDKIKFGNLFLKEKEKALKNGRLIENLVDLHLYDRLFEFSPPSNSSIETKKELKQIVGIVNSISEPALEFCKKAEDNLVQVFIDFLERRSITDTTRKDLDKILDETEPLLYKLKEYYNRPRPNQLAVYYNLNLHVPIEVKNANHPSYPSGHSYEGYIIANLLSQRYPKYKKQLMKLGNNIGLSRILIGLHFKSDHDFGKRLGKLLIENNLVEFP